MRNSNKLRIMISFLIFGAFLVGASQILSASSDPIRSETMKAVSMDASVTKESGDINKTDNYGNVKIELSRGQNLSYIAKRYTGDAKNWSTIAKTSGLNTDDKSQRHLLVGTVLVIPQSLVKEKFLPTPNEKVFKLSLSTLKRTEDELIAARQEVKDLEWWVRYWRAVCLMLGVALFLVLCVAFSLYRQSGRSKRSQESLMNELERYKGLALTLPGNTMKFEFREGQVVEAIITRVDYEPDDRGGKSVIAEVGCQECALRLKPDKFKSHYSQRHSDKLDGVAAEAKVDVAGGVAKTA